MHKTRKTYTERGLASAHGKPTTVDVFVMECTCGWKEKAYDGTELLTRFNAHRRNLGKQA